MSYHRVIPRDLFNEAKLLKCLGQLALIIHDGVRVPRTLRLIMEDDEGFTVEQDECDGSLYCTSVALYCGSWIVNLRSPYNSKDAYPLLWSVDGEEGRVFTEAGELSPEFCATMEGIRT